MEKYTYVTLRQKPLLKGTAAEWFHSKWQVPKEAYLESMDAYLDNKTEYGWYLCLDGEKIVGGLGVIENDFHNRKDLTPNICAVYTEKNYRCQGIAGNLLKSALADLKHKSITPVYLLTIPAFMKNMAGNFYAWFKEMANQTCQECTFTDKSLI